VLCQYQHILEGHIPAYVLTEVGKWLHAFIQKLNSVMLLAARKHPEILSESQIAHHVVAEEVELNVCQYYAF
jgi:hypothetical protein